jgi:hypothetical protein
MTDLNGQPTRESIHYRPFTSTWNVRCLNGSAHAKRTTHFEHVTCPLCLNKNTCKSFWIDYEIRNGNVNKVSNIF